MLLLVIQSSTIYAQKPILTIEEALSDFSFLCEKMENVHPNNKLDKEILEIKQNSIKEQLSRGETTIEDFYMLTAPYLASIKDGHSNMLPIVAESRMKYLNSGGLTMPIKISISNGHLIVDKILADSSQYMQLEGDTIVSINGISSSTPTTFLYSLIGSEDNNHIKDNYINPMISTLLWYKYKWGNTYTINTKSSNTLTKGAIFEGISQDVALYHLSKLSRNRSDDYSLSVDALESKAILTIRTFRNPKDLGIYLNQAFKNIHHNNIQDLTIDLRGNGGGSSAAVDSLIFHLTNQPFRLYKQVLLKISPELKSVYKNKYPSIYKEIQDIEDGNMYQLEYPIIQSDKKHIYTGNLTIICNEKTYSGASSFVSLANHLSLGKVQGQTGEPRTYCADYLFFKLPNSQINFTISMKRFIDF